MEIKVKISLSLFIFFLLLQTMLFGNDKNNIENGDACAVVFMYHRFGETTYPSTNITIKQFQEHLNYLEENDYNVWPFSKIVRYIIKGKDLPKKTVALTIDDAYTSIYTKAYPMLKKKKFPFTVFVNTSPIGAKSVNYMSWEQMREISLSGAEFANHSLTHDFLLPRKSESQIEWQSRLRNEIEGAQKQLHKELGGDTNEKPKLFSYPFGEYSQQTANYIRSLGYIGITQTSGVIDLYSDLKALPRFAMSETLGNLDGFILKLNTLPLPIASVSPYEPILKDKNPPKLLLKLKHPIKKMKCFIANGEEIKIKWLSEQEAEIEANRALEAPRDRYTCTAPAKNGKWYWYSHLWIINNNVNE